MTDLKRIDSPKTDLSISKLYPRENYSMTTYILFYVGLLFALVLFWGLVFDGFAIFR